jgi:hypothetical protein
MYTTEHLNALLEDPMYGWDTLTLLGDVEDFLNVSEANIHQQWDSELKRTKLECADIEFDDPRMSEIYLDHQIENVNYRFGVSLTQRVRYSGLTALITSIEWALMALARNLKVQMPTKPKGVSEAVHLLSLLASRTKINLESEIALFGLLTQVRNCIVHSARHDRDIQIQSGPS